MAEPTQPQQPRQPPGAARVYDHPGPSTRWSVGDWAWFIVKNILGWILILGSGPIGLAVPGPGGLPLFIIGFALITFPGKRHITARILRGTPVHPENRGYRITVAAIALLAPLGLIIWLSNKWQPFLIEPTPKAFMLAGTYLACVIVIWTFGLHGVHVINRFLAALPRARRKVRPWMRRKGLDLLPPRRRWRLRRHGSATHIDQEILELHERHLDRLRRIGRFCKPWFLRFFRVIVVAAIFWWMLKDVYYKWDDPQIQGPILAMSGWRFAGAAGMFALFLFTFRALAWRRILAGMGHELPILPATRIWSMSELARYLPGVIWQVVGRVYLSKPYGVSASVSSASQVLELTIFMLANILVALGCLATAGVRQVRFDQLYWVFTALAFVPVLLLLLHPRVFYGLLNAVLGRFKKPPITQRLPKRLLGGLVVWTILGLLWQSLAIWLLTSSTLHLPLGKWYVVAGAYCLAWTIGFSVGFMFPGGIGVREAVFIATLQLILDERWAAANLHFTDPARYLALLGFLGVLLRLWAMAGELTMASIAYAGDYRGALGHPDAPGRLPLTQTVSPAQPTLAGQMPDVEA